MSCTKIAIKHAILWKLPYWKKKWNGAEDYFFFRECLMIPSCDSYVNGFIKRGLCGRCGKNLDVWCPDCRENVRLKTV